ncbi:MAG: hypothetical protein SFW67_03225 [Myxococcaceae bacterium]|nr:hypothetical protein [Myxococcaceae bacterium]
MVFSRRHVFFAALSATVTGLFAGACGQSNPCFRILCESPRVCNPQLGACELPAGFDGGTRRDAGIDCSPECATGEFCDRSAGRCVQCLVNADCRCPTPACVDGRCTPDTTTVQAVPAGDTCATAPSFIACGPKTFTVDTNLTTASPSVQASCAVRDAGAGDVMFNIVLGTPSDLRVSVAANGGGAQPVIAVRQRCEADVDLACRSSQGINTTYRVRRLPEGAYTVVIQGYDRAGSGPALATVAVEAPSGSSNETCPLAERLPLDGGTVRPELVGADDDAALSCNTGGGPELFYRFALTELSDVTVTATSTDPLRPALALYSSCEAGTAPLACATTSTANGRLVARRLGAGEYVLAVENQGQATMGRLELSATTEPARPPPSNDTCAIPADLTFAGNEATVLADSSRGTDDTTASCGGGGSPDLVYRFSVPATATYTITATPQAGSGAAPVLSLRKNQCGAAPDGGSSEVACQPPPAVGQPVTLTALLTPDTYYLWVDSTQASTAGAVTLTVRR